MQEMREVQLTSEQAKYLRSLELPSEFAAILGEPLHRTFRLTTAQKDVLLSIIGERLQRRGFDAEYEPTPDGQMLESLIDALSSAKA